MLGTRCTPNAGSDMSPGTVWQEPPPAGGGPRQQHLLRPLSLWRGALCSDGTASHVGPHRDLLPNRPKRFGRTGWRCGRGAVVARGAAKRIAGDRKKQTARLTLATGPHSAERRRKAVAPRCVGARVADKPRPSAPDRRRRACHTSDELKNVCLGLS